MYYLDIKHLYLGRISIICALPDKYRHLAVSLLLLDKLDKFVIIQAFQSEELNQ